MRGNGFNREEQEDVTYAFGIIKCGGKQFLLRVSGLEWLRCVSFKINVTLYSTVLVSVTVSLQICHGCMISCVLSCGSRSPDVQCDWYLWRSSPSSHTHTCTCRSSPIQMFMCSTAAQVFLAWRDSTPPSHLFSIRYWQTQPTYKYYFAPCFPCVWALLEACKVVTVLSYGLCWPLQLMAYWLLGWEAGVFLAKHQVWLWKSEFKVMVGKNIRGQTHTQQSDYCTVSGLWAAVIHRVEQVVH